MRPRPYQTEAVDAVIREFERVRSTLVVSPTGTGKTHIAAHIIERMVPRGRCMVVADRSVLIEQAAKKIARVSGIIPDIEKADKYTDEFLNPSKIVVASVQSLNSGMKKPRYERFYPEDFSLLFIDECHKSPVNSFRRVIEHFKQNSELRFVGVTATADRADGKSLVGPNCIFDSVAFEYRMDAAIQDGYLVPFEQEFIPTVSLDFSQIRTSAGDLNGKQLAAELEKEGPIHEMVVPTIEKIGDKKTLYFAQSVAQAEKTVEIFNRYKPGCAECVFGKTDDEARKEILRSHGTRFQVLVNVGVLIEGYDDPELEVIVMGRPTESRARYAQMAGRGARPLDGLVDQFETDEERREAIASSRKPFVTILDFVGNSGKHKLITTLDIMGADLEEEVIAWAKKNIIDNRKPAEVSKALKQASREVQDERRRKEEERRRNIKANASYKSYKVDPFKGDQFRIQKSSAPQHWYFTPATEKQLAALDRRGIEHDEGLTIAQASRLLDQITPGQKSLLQKRGIKTDGMTKADASNAIEAIKENGWRVPPELEHLRRGKAS